MPKISVIMPVYNESINNVNDSIESILNQTYKDFELIIIDDNPASYVISDYLLKKKKESSKIKLIFNNKNLNVVHSTNKGINQSKGKYIVKIDADDIATKNRLNNQLIFLNKYDLDLTYSNFSLINNKREITRKFNYGKKNLLNQYKIKKIMIKSNIALGTTFFFKKELFYQLKGYRNMNCEDYDLVTRALINGFKVGYQGQPLLLKTLRKNSISYNSLLYQYILMNTVGNYLKEYNYTRTIPLQAISNEWEKITSLQKDNFNKYANARYNFSDKKSFINLFKLIRSIITSKIVFNRCINSLINKIRYKYIYR